MCYMVPEFLCSTCGQFHGRGGHVEGPTAAFSTLNAANSNFKVSSEPAVRKRMSASEAMAHTKVKYKETLDYLA